MQEVDQKKSAETWKQIQRENITPKNKNIMGQVKRLNQKNVMYTVSI